ncbi:MAG: NAD(P)H-hydrate dehydratase [Lachnospiraceae bacterium]|nr:NAD(P)H-hydrate dehydratase [Lachnospiraceae bacterium]
MEYVVTSEEMRAYDTYTIEYMGVPSLVLMERAALKTVECIMEVGKCIEETAQNLNIQKKMRVLCVCGTGNNGGDGLCVARLLREQDIKADAVLIGNRQKLTKETALQLSVLEKYGVTVGNKVPEAEYDIIVDALFGIGLSREITGEARGAIEAVNAKAAYKIALDIPSGIDADTGKVWGHAVKADETVAIAFKKRGHCLYPGSLFAGKIRVADIGITKRSFDGREPQMYTYTDSVTNMCPNRLPYGNKGTFGKVLIVAGSSEMAGAALLCGESAYRTGAGMVKLVIPENIREIVQTKLPEALIQTYASKEGITKAEETAFLQNTEWADVIAIGPGLSVCKSGLSFLIAAAQSTKPLLIDADGLNMLAEENRNNIETGTELQKGMIHEIDMQNTSDSQNLWMLIRKRKNRTVLTPHMGELARLLQKPVSEVIADETVATQELAQKSGCIVVGKSARTHVCKAGERIFLNTAGNDKMATAGSGDVLAGIIAALMAQEAKNCDHRQTNDIDEAKLPDNEACGKGQEELDSMESAVCLGVYLHACAGDIAANKAGKAGITASDIIKGLGLLMQAEE